jgi:plastocyanin
MEGSAMNRPRRLTAKLLAAIGAALAGLLLSSDLGAEQKGPTTHTIFLTALEVKGSTTTDKLAPPSVNPADLSKGYGFKAPGQADKNAPQKWEVSTYIFNPAFATVRQGDEVVLTTFVVNGDEHEMWVTAPDGRRAVEKTTWNRGREYTVRFRADQVGAYQLTCSSHAPSMAATFLVLPK